MSTRHSPSLSKKSEAVAPAGGALLLPDSAPANIFTPENLLADAHLMGETMEGFVRNGVLPLRPRLEAHEPGLLRDLVDQAGQLGLLAGGLPHPYGLALPKTTLALLAEKSGIDLSFAVTIGVHAGVAAYPLLFFGTDEQKARYLPAIATGKMAAAFSLTEANAGSDAFALETRARSARDSSHYLINGTKLWVTNAGIADIFTVFAHPDGVGPTAFLVERNSAGVTVGPEESKMGLQSSSTCRIMLSDAPAELLGKAGNGHLAALYALNLGRFQIGAISLGGAKEALRLAVRYSAHRGQSGRPIAEFGLVRQKLAEMPTQIFALESMIYRLAGYWDTRLAGVLDQAAALAAASEEYAIECALVKFFGSEVLGFAVDQALQIHGGYGFSEEFAIARLYRDSRVFRIFEGTNEISRLVVAQQIRRRWERGRLPLDHAIAHPESISWPTPSDPLAFAGAAVAQIRRLLLATLAQSRAVADDQIIAANIADLCAWLFALESAWLRCRKPPPLPASPVELAMLLLLADYASHQAADLARSSLACAGVDGGEISSLLRPTFERPLVDTTPLHSAIAQALVDRE